MTNTLLSATDIAQQFSHLETIGRVSGKVHTVELGFAVDEDASRIYLVSGRQDRSDWYRNVRANGAVRFQIGDGPWMTGTARLVTDEREIIQIRLEVADKYRHFAGSTDWIFMAMPVVIDLTE